MPLIKSASRAAVGENIKREAAAGRPRRQAIAVALDVQRRAKKADGGAVTDRQLTPAEAVRVAQEAEAETKQRMGRGAVLRTLGRLQDEGRARAATSGGYGRARGGAVPHMAPGGAIDMPFAARAGAKALERSGMIRSPVAGRTDALPANVKSGSYVMPADTISGLGQGNSMAGANAMNKLLKMGPYGAAIPHPSAGAGMRMPTGGMMKGRRGFADGGAAEEMAGAPTDVIVAGGEFIIPVEKVAEIGGGDVPHGHEILDAMVSHIRKKTIKTLRKLPKPKKN